MKREGLKIQMAANYADTMPDYVDGNYVRGLEDGYKKGWDDADSHPKNPWRDAKTDPPKDGKPVIGIDKYGSISKYEYMPDEKMWAIGIGIFICDVPEYWMPIPELKKGE